jgi:hypothetical protein
MELAARRKGHCMGDTMSVGVDHDRPSPLHRYIYSQAHVLPLTRKSEASRNEELIEMPQSDDTMAW